MKKLKKIMLVCLSMLLTMSFVAIPAQAADVDDTVVQPRWSNMAILHLSFAFPQEGYGCAEASFAGQPGTTKIVAEVHVYKKSGLIWRYVDEETVTVNAMNGMLSCIFTATQGTEYKAEYKFTVTKNGVDEVVEKTQYKTYE